MNQKLTLALSETMIAMPSDAYWYMLDCSMLERESACTILCHAGAANVKLGQSLAYADRN